MTVIKVLYKLAGGPRLQHVQPIGKSGTVCVTNEHGYVPLVTLPSALLIHDLSPGL